MTPGMSNKPYIQWQRGPLAKTSVPLMKSWVDTLLARNNVWLVLTFHGVDGIGWEAKPHQELQQYFSYMKQHNDNLWIAPFRDVTKYLRERMAAKVNSREEDDALVVTLEHSLDKALYNYPLTLKTYVPDDWAQVRISQGGKEIKGVKRSDDRGTFVLYDAMPNSEAISLTSL
jgi:hypothetical protein